MRISCTGAKCVVTEVEYMASGAINYFTASFTFDSAWSDFISANKLYGIFEGSDSVILTTLVYNSETQTYDCDVPWETIKYQGELLVGVIGHLTTPETKILTTNMAFGYKIPEGAATNATTGSQPSGLLLDILEAAEQVGADADRAQTNADRAEANADRAEVAVNHFPYIDPTTNNWFKWDVATGVFVDTGVDATGAAAGFGTPTISVVQGAEGTQPQVAITATGPDTAKVFDFDFTLPKGDTGDTGAAAKVTIGTAETGAPGTDAQVTNSGDEHFAVLHFTIPQGLKGDQGIQGIQGLKGDTGQQGIQGIQGLKGDKGDQGIQGIQGIQGLKGDTGQQGPQGIQGLKGDTGEDFVVIGHYDTLVALQTAVPNPSIGDVYSIGAVIPYNIYLYDGITHAWIDYGTIQGPTGATGAKGEATYWYTGTTITGTSTSDTIFSGSGIALANIKDLYLNTTTDNIYKCTLGGNASTATWVYIGNIKGATGATGAAGADASIDIVRW